MKSLYESILDVDVNIGGANQNIKEYNEFIGLLRQGLDVVFDGEGPTVIRKAPTTVKKPEDVKMIRWSNPEAIDCTGKTTLRMENEVKARVRKITDLLKKFKAGLYASKESRIAGDVYYPLTITYRLPADGKETSLIPIRMLMERVNVDNTYKLAWVAFTVPTYMCDSLYPQSRGVDDWIDTEQAVRKDLKIKDTK